MQADYAVELGPNDEALELPWMACDQGLQYYDLKRRPELLSSIEEARRFPELRQFLAAINLPASHLETAKCDAWPSTDILPEEAIFGSASKFGSYIDLIFSESGPRFSFSEHEQLAGGLCRLLRRTPEIPATAEFLIRRCYYRDGGNSSEQGFYVTFYSFGFGSNEAAARRQWAIGLKLAENAILQLSLS